MERTRWIGEEVILEVEKREVVLVGGQEKEGEGQNHTKEVAVREDGDSVEA